MRPPGVKCLVVAVLTLAAMSSAAVIEYPTVAAGEEFARQVLATTTPAGLDEEFRKNPDAIPVTLRNFGSALMTADAALRAEVERFLVALASHRAQRVDGKFTDDDVRMVVSFAVVDPMRFINDSAFRARVIPGLQRALDPSISAALRRACLRDLNDDIGLDFETAENVTASWGMLRRRSSERRVAFRSGLRMPDDIRGPIETSIYSINSQFFSADEARKFLNAVRAAAPKRRIVVLSDMKLDGVTVIDTFARPYTPWPRDPFTVARAKNGGVILINRPNLQPDREEDANMVRALVQGAPFDAQWTVAPMPFHNGHILLTPRNVWISIHTVEIRALQLLRIDRVPVETFHTKEGIARYLAAVQKAAKELEVLYGKPVRFVHPLDAQPALMQRLGGGGGFDLDSLMTLLPKSDGSLTALVGDINLGAKVARDADWSPYSITADVASAQSSPRNVALQTFLDTVAAHLAANGVKVRRLPLINVPGEPKDFLVTWNNVVLEAKGKARRAEGFASLLPAGDGIARKTFRAAGYELTLFPPLMRSVMLNGGYRCASNHVRP